MSERSLLVSLIDYAIEKDQVDDLVYYVSQDDRPLLRELIKERG